jgi:hypothetical protein
MASFVYNRAKLALMEQEFDFSSDTFKVALVTAGYAADIDAHEFFDDVTNETSGTGYTAGGKVLQDISLTRDDNNDWIVLDADDLTWALASFVTHGAVIYKSTGTAGTSMLFAYIDFEEDLNPDGEDFLLQWHNQGILTLGA